MTTLRKPATTRIIQRH